MTISRAKGCAALIATAILLGLQAPGGAGASTSHTVSGGTLIYQTIGNPSNLDPAFQLINSSTSGPPMEAVYGQLIGTNPKTGGVVYNGFAKSMTSSDGYKRWVLQLHSGLKFSDGTAFNAAAVQADITRLATPATGSSLLTFAQSLNTKVLNATELQVTLSASNTQLPAFFAQDFAFIPSPTAVASEGTSFGANPVGAGPFKLVGWDVPVSMTLTKNKYYSLFVPGEPYVNNLEIQLVGSYDQEIASLKTNAANIGSIVAYTYGSELAADKNLRVLDTTIGGGGGIYFNMSVPPFNNLLAREAVSLALNADSLGQAFWPGDPTADNLFASTSPYYNAKDDFPKQNPAMAQQLFNEYAAQTGHPLQFSVTDANTSQNVVQTDDLLAQMGAYTNVQMTVQNLPVATYEQDIASFSYQAIAEATFAVGPIPIYISTLQTGGPKNFSLYNSPTVDGLIAKIEATNNLTLQKKYWGEVAQQVDKDYPFFWGAYPAFVLTWNPKVITDVYPTELGNIPLFAQIRFVHK